MMSRRMICSMGFVMVIALVVVAGSWTPTRAQSRMPWHGPGGGRSDAGMMLPLLLRSAHLSPEQDAKVREILAARRTASRALVGELRQAQEDLADKLFAPGVVKDTDLQPQLQKIAQLREQLLQEGAKATLEVRALLTPEQLGRAAQVKDRFRQLRTEMRQLVEPGSP
jgi:Spy/CpxP family protein refolding chaperone